MRKFKEGPAAWIAAVAAVVIIPVTIFFGMSSKEGPPVVAPTSSAAQSGNVVPPTAAAPESAERGTICVRENGAEIACSSADAWLVVPVSHCDPEAATRAMGFDPDEIELQIETRSIAGRCGVAPSAAARSIGVTPNDLTDVNKGRPPAGVVTCWQAADPSTAVPCSQPHQFEPAAQWRPLYDQSELQSLCPEAVRRYVAGPADSMDGGLTTIWVISQEQVPRYRCVVKSRDTLAGTVYRLSGRPLPTAASG